VQAEIVTRTSKCEDIRKKITPDEIAGLRRKRFIIELEKAGDGYAKIHELEQYSP